MAFDLTGSLEHLHLAGGVRTIDSGPDAHGGDRAPDVLAAHDLGSAAPSAELPPRTGDVPAEDGRPTTTRAAEVGGGAGMANGHRLAGSTAAHPAAPSFDDALAAHEVEIYRYLRRLSPTAEDAADLHQETFLRAFRAWGRLDASANVRAWLYRIAGNLARDAHRRRSVRNARAASASMRQGQTTGLDEVASTAAADPHAAAEASMLVEAVREGLLSLTERQRLAVIARVLDARDYADVAGAIGCSEATARQHVSHGLGRLRHLLREWMEVAP